MLYGCYAGSPLLIQLLTFDFLWKGMIDEATGRVEYHLPVRSIETE